MHLQRTFLNILKEPLFHFVLIGFGLFYLFSQVNDTSEQPTSQLVNIDASTLQIVSDLFIEENGRQPTTDELHTAINKEIKEEILYREALAINLEKNDRIIRHRLAQKMQYLFEDVTMIDEPSDDELLVYYKNNPKKFIGSFSELKLNVLDAYMSTELKKQNESFYNNLKSRYHISIDEEVQKSLNMRTAKQ